MKAKKKDMKIFVIAYKQANNMPNDDIYIPMHAGKKGKEDLGYLGDDTGDNISDRNFSYCELTGAYWIWKNVKCDIVGLVHYRRFFYPNRLIFNFKRRLNEKDINRLLNKYDVIIPEKGYTYPRSSYQEYEDVHDINDLMKCRDIIKEKYPDYLDAFDKVIHKKYYSQYNMIITSKEIFDEYSKWLFDILAPADKTFNYEGLSSYHQRKCGFIGERLLSVWVEKNKQYKVKEMPVYNTEMNLFKQEVIYFIKKIMDIFVR